LSAQAIRADVVGSLLRPDSLKAARARWERGDLSAAAFKRVEDRAVDEAVRLQEEAGLDVVTDGDGGKVIVWADDWTKYFGSISARGGAQTGDGGLVEVSGKVLKMSPDLASRVYDEEIKEFSKDGKFDPKAVSILAESYVGMGLLDRKPANDEIFTTRFLP